MRKKNTRIPYYRSIDYVKLSAEERTQYDKDKLALRRNMRALVAYQDNPDCTDGSTKKTMNSVFERYRLSGDRSYAVSEVMRAFWGNDRYEDEIIPIYARKNEYDNAHPSDKKYFDKTYSPTDYMSIETMYHYYKFRKTIMDLDSKQKFASFDKLLDTAREKYMSKPNAGNMYFSPKDLSLEKTAIPSYTNIIAQQRKISQDVAKTGAITINDQTVQLSDKEIMEYTNTPITEFIKADVVNYMLSYVDETKKSLSEATRQGLKQWYTAMATNGIIKRGLSEHTEEALKAAYTFAENVPEGMIRYTASPKQNTANRENKNANDGNLSSTNRTTEASDKQSDNRNTKDTNKTISQDKVTTDTFTNLEPGTQLTLFDTSDHERQ